MINMGETKSTKGEGDTKIIPFHLLISTIFIIKSIIYYLKKKKQVYNIKAFSQEIILSLIVSYH